MVPLLILWLEIHCRPSPALLRTQTTDKNRIKLLQEIVITLFSVQPNKSQDVQRAEAAPQCCSNINYLWLASFLLRLLFQLRIMGLSRPRPQPLSSMDSISLYSRQWSGAHWLGLAGIKMVWCIFISDTIFRRLQNRYSHCDNNSYTIPALKPSTPNLETLLRRHWELCFAVPLIF